MHKHTLALVLFIVLLLTLTNELYAGVILLTSSSNAGPPAHLLHGVYSPLLILSSITTKLIARVVGVALLGCVTLGGGCA
jgi:hypothetical protein